LLNRQRGVSDEKTRFYLNRIDDRHRGDRSKSRSKLEACKSNVKSVAVALEVYGADNNGIYLPPPNNCYFLTDSCYLVKSGHLKKAILCPAVAVSREYSYVIQSVTEQPYYVYCHPGYGADRRASHPEVPIWFPAYSQNRGLILE